MWFVPGWAVPASVAAGAMAPSTLPMAIFMGLFCSYIWARVKPLVDNPKKTSKTDYILQDLSNATSFLSNLQETLFTSTSSAKPKNTESISKAGEDVLLKRTASRMQDGRRTTSESITATLTIATTVDPREVSRLRRKMRSMAPAGLTKEHVHVVSEGSVLLQARLPISSTLLSQAFEVARRAIALDPGATLQLGNYGIIMLSSEGEVKLLRLDNGDAPVLLDSFREEDEDLRVEGLFLRGVQMRATIGDKSVVLRSKTLLKDEGGWVDALVAWPPLVTLEKSSLLYATKIVEFKGVTATVRSNLLPVSFNRKPKDEDHTGLYLAAALATVVALTPSSAWLPVIGKIGTVFLPVFQMAAVILGWNLGHFLLLGEWPTTRGDREVTLDSEEEMKEFGINLFKYITPWDSAVRMEMGDLERQLAQKLESQPSVSNAGIYAQQADYRTEFWRKGVAEMDQAIEIEPKTELPFRIRGCIKGLAGNYEGAVKDLDQALTLKPTDVLTLIDRGVFKFLGGDLVGALADLNEAIKLDPTQPKDILALRDAIAQILADREELAKLREENLRLKAELEALRVKAAEELAAAEAKAKADLEAAEAKAKKELEEAQAKAKADLEEAQAKAKADLEAAEARAAAERAKSEAEAADLKSKNERLQEELSKAQETLRNMPSNQTLELQYNNLCCEKCVRDIKAALKKVPGVESVDEDFMEGKVTVTGYVSAAVILSVCRQTSPKKVIYLVGDEIPQAYASAPKEFHEPAPAPAPAPEPAPEAAPEAPPAPEAAPEAAPAPDAPPAPEAAPEAAPAPEVPAPEAAAPAPEAPPAPEATPEAAPTPEAAAPESAPEAPPAPEAAPEAAPAPAPKATPAREAEAEEAPVREPIWEADPDAALNPKGLVPEPVSEAVPEASPKVEANGNAEPKQNGEVQQENK